MSNASYRLFTAVAHTEHAAPALRMAVGIAVPTGTLVILHHTDLVMYAAFGAFTGMYGRGAPRSVRIRHQAAAAAILATGVIAGIALSQGRFPASTLALSEAAFAAAASVLADRIGFRPIGPFFGLFAFGACAALPPADGRIVPAASACLAAALFALALGALLPTTRAEGGDLHLSPSPRGTVRRASEYALAITVAGSGAAAFGIGHPHWAMASAAVPLAADSLSGRLSRGMHRIGGTFAGLTLTALVLATDPSPAITALLVVSLQFPTELFIARHYGLALVFFTPLILLMTQLAVQVPTDVLLRDRAVETVAGVAAGLAVLLVSQALSRAGDLRALRREA